MMCVRTPCGLQDSPAPWSPAFATVPLQFRLLVGRRTSVSGCAECRCEAGDGVGSSCRHFLDATRWLYFRLYFRLYFSGIKPFQRGRTPYARSATPVPGVPNQHRAFRGHFGKQGSKVVQVVSKDMQVEGWKCH